MGMQWVIGPVIIAGVILIAGLAFLITSPR